MYAKNVWTDASSEKKESIFSFNEDYKAFLSLAKTERTATKEAIKLAEAAGFKNLEDVKSVKPGDKIYAVNKDKNFLAVIIGKIRRHQEIPLCHHPTRNPWRRLQERRLPR